MINKQILTAKQNFFQNDGKDRQNSSKMSKFNEEIPNKAHNTEVRFLIFIYNGEHFYDWFIQKKPVTVLYDFIFNKLKESDSKNLDNKRFENLKMENIHIYTKIKDQKEEIPYDDKIFINEKISGTSTGRSTLEVSIF